MTVNDRRSTVDEAGGELSWDPAQYERFAAQRGRPFHDLMAWVGATEPRRVVDLGCGPGPLTATLAERWPTARIEGVDSSADMIEQASTYRIDGRLEFTRADLRTWRPDGQVDVLVSNATFQWVPGHLELFGDLLDCVADGGWFAFGVPANFDAPNHTLLRELAAEPRWAEAIGRSIVHPSAPEPDAYLEALIAAGCEDIQLWETTYHQILGGADPVLQWMKGTGARPYLQALPDDTARAKFEAEYAERLRAVYPPRSFGTVLPFRRIFAVARKGTSDG